MLAHAFDQAQRTQFDPAAPYGSAWQAWHAKGWPVLILPTGRKASPPAGFSGYAGTDASYADLHAWGEERPGGNIAIRMPLGVVGVDVDSYEKGGKIKTGDRTIARWEAQAGVRFPATWRITSRGLDNPSGKSLFRIPEGVRLRTAEGDVELLQRHHRYAVTAPSRNGDDGGSVVRIYGPDGVEITDPADLPSPADLPELPAALVELLRDTAEVHQHVRTLADGERPAFLAALPDGSPCTAMRRAADKALAACRGQSRHDDVLRAVGGILRVGHWGHPGAHTVLAEVEHEFVTAVASSRRGGAAEAAGEFARMVNSDRITALISDGTTSRGCRCGIKASIGEIADYIRRALDTDNREDRVRMLETIMEVFGDAEFDPAFQLATGHAVRDSQPTIPALRAVIVPPDSPRTKPCSRPTGAVGTETPAGIPEPPIKGFDWWRWDLSHAGNGQRFCAYHGADRIAYVPGANVLRSWTGAVWETDDGAALRHLVERMTEAMLLAAQLDVAAVEKSEEEIAAAVLSAKASSDKDAESAASTELSRLRAVGKTARARLKFCISSRMGSALDQAGKSARSDPRLRVKAGEWDANPRLLNCANGTLEIDYDGTPTLREHRAADRLTQQCGTVYDPAATAPSWEKFLGEAIPDAGVRRVFRALAGLTLVGDNAEHLFGFLIGPTRSGKTVALETLGKALDNTEDPALGYSSTFELSVLRPKRESGGNPQLVRLLDRRMVWTAETADGLPLNADQLKRFCGGDRIAARDNYVCVVGVQDRAPKFLPWAAANKPPQIEGADAALAERIIAIPFPNTRPADQRETRLADRIAREEGSGVLNWALAGLTDVIANPQILRSELPEPCRQAREEMFAEVNPVRRWLAEATEPCPCENGHACVTNPAAWTAFAADMDDQRERGITLNAFSRALKDAGHPAVVVKIGGRAVKVRRGLRLTDEYRAELARRSSEDERGAVRI